MTNEEQDKQLKALRDLLNEHGKSLEERLNRVTKAFSDALENGASREYVEKLVETQSILNENLKLQRDQGKLLLIEQAKGRTLSTHEVDIINKLTQDLQKLAIKEAELNASLKKMDQKGGTTEGYEMVRKSIKSIEKEKEDLIDAAKDAAYALTQQSTSDLSRAIDNMKDLYDNEEKRHAIAVKINKLDRESLELEKETLALKKKDADMVAEGARRWDAIKQIFIGIKAEIQDGASMWMQYNAQAISDSKRLGVTNIEGVRAYTQALMENSKQLSRNFGMSAEQAMKMQETYSKVTGRATLLTRSQMEDIAASSKLMGEETVTNAIKIMDDMGTTSQTATELMDKNYARAVNSGLDTVKASEEFVENLSLANRLSFRNGVDGISKMTILSQRIRMNFQEVANVAEKFSTIEGALQGSAQLQMLGGVGAMYGGNPMQMMFEALSDPEALFERMGKMFGEQATFDRRTGEARISPLQLQIMREQAKAMGMNPDEAVQSAKQQAKNKDIEAQWRAANPSLYNQASEEERAKILNKAQFNKETGGWEVSYMDETGEQKTADVRNLSADEMAEIMKDQIDPVQDIRGRVREIAMTLVGTKERLDSMKDQWKTGKAQALNGIMETGDTALTNINQNDFWGKYITGSGVVTWLSMLGMGAAGGASTFLLPKVMKKFGFTENGFYRFLTGGKSAAPIVNKPQITPPKISSGPTPSSGPIAESVRGGARYGRRALAAGRGAGRGALKSVGGKIGSVAAVAYGAYEAYSGWQDANAEHAYRTGITDRLYASGRIGTNERSQRDLMARNQRTRERSEAVGAGVGTAVGGIAGIAAGAAAGAATGAAIGSVVPGIGTAVGLIVGGAVGILGGILGKKAGSEMGKALEEHDKDDTVGRELAKINDSDEEENLRRIVLPIESIDYNVALIANQLGVISAMPARGNVFLDAEANGEIQAEGVPLQAGHVNSNEAGANQSYQSRPVSGSLTLNVNGKIELTGAGNSSLSAADIKNMIESSRDFQRYLTSLIADEVNRNANAQRASRENQFVSQATVAGQSTIGRNER